MPIQPIEQKSPIHEQLSWFASLTCEQIFYNQDQKFKNELKKNVLIIVTRTIKLFREKIDAWPYFQPQTQSFGCFLKSVFKLALSPDQEFDLSLIDRCHLLTFLNYTFNSIEVDFVHEQIRKLLPMSIWANLSKNRRANELAKLPKNLQGVWNKLEKQQAKMEPNKLAERLLERKLIYDYLLQFLDLLKLVVPQQSTDEVNMDVDTEQKTDLNNELALYCLKFMEFVIDLDSQLPLRRFFHALLDSTHFIIRCKLSSFARHESAEGNLFTQLLELLVLYHSYDLDMITGEPLSDVESMKKHEQHVQTMQKVIWKQYDDLKDFALMSVQSIDNRMTLKKIASNFPNSEELFMFLKSIGIVDEYTLNEEDRVNLEFMTEIFITSYSRKQSQLKKINTIPLLPSEYVIWDLNLVPDKYYNYEYPLALPKLNLQFITLSDYLLRNFMLFKHESTYEIRQDIEDGVTRSKCRWNADGKFATGPKQRMSLILKEFSLIEIGKPKLGESCPSFVRAKVTINMDYVRLEWRREWENLRKHDICFLVSFEKPSANQTSKKSWLQDSFPQKNGINFVRGCEIETLLDSDGKPISEYSESPNFKDNLRTFIVSLDCNQYKLDETHLQKTGENVYEKFHLIIRRKPEQNNLKGVLETIKSLMNSKFVVPSWLNDLLLGFGDPADAHYKNVMKLFQSGDCEHSFDKDCLDYFDTFTSCEHMKESFKAIRPNYSFNILDTSVECSDPLFKVLINDDEKLVQVKPYKFETSCPLLSSKTKRNTIEFTPNQIEAITSGLQPGLTMVVGPPGTGKTDVAVQILSCLYHSHPNQRTLIVTHSNQALNQIFEKMTELDVEEHHLLRMGHGEEDLQSSKDFSRRGRVNYVLKRRAECLLEVERLADSLDIEQTTKFTCESAEYFNFHHIATRWKQFDDITSSAQGDLSIVKNAFPFTTFFASDKSLFNCTSYEDDLKIANACYKYIEKIFKQLDEFRPFEIFSNASDQSKYLLIRVAKVIAMTCTHAGLRRKELVEMNFQYDNILMEETAQILEIETTIPLLLQNPENGVNRLKRWIMIGDHNQLPPIIQNSAFQKFSNMEQSLFARFIRFGVPSILLDAQGRSRKSLCDLYRWRYGNLKELPLIEQNQEFKLANAGFLHEYQMINVPDYNNLGEETPSPHCYMNRGEAEFMVATYKYMRALGYPANKITLLTTYNGQKQLLKELIDRECNQYPNLGAPSKIATVDKFQGQQNDYILLSLVRTKTVGHVRDIRRLVVAMSRARLGLYVFARVNLFASCFELSHLMRQFTSKSQALCLLPDELFPTKRLLEEPTNFVEKPAGENVRMIHGLDDMLQFVSDKILPLIKT